MLDLRELKPDSDTTVGWGQPHKPLSLLKWEMQSSGTNSKGKSKAFEENSDHVLVATPEVFQKSRHAAKSQSQPS
jgi:hypothetical protein